MLEQDQRRDNKPLNPQSYETSFCLTTTIRVLYRVRRNGYSLPYRGFLQQLSRTDLRHVLCDGICLLQGKELVTF